MLCTTGAGAGNPDKFELYRAGQGSAGEEVRVQGR